uniref:Roadblock/LAMTOR2 domain-containing protein n=1 Tax=Phaeomonas parva TaxID=124430 RepID=A0A7S1U883_9STRA|mmetsp:Transcript_36390/g.114073  ORF Transcript_36390/g.114073 Transcript_36390/m.114073 type:complete len:121 (+) Transcript_36390:122-484(+)|eukprot:CAMPEP_0118860116 /NCGR_PEP_ID=MMETSP1163-20130328/6081_1 /TAXON_ID=124430 /ORGANISM="Phaeomonas parva, Strain CCMP2877" /LENGTH=120 /DNA_ID=CAMNT_0006793773 /DNA_START=105 /DNA_END=467 /DNA_ORIENTATION=+
MASQQVNEAEEVIKELKMVPGFHSYMILNNDGIVIKWENMQYRSAIQCAHLVLDLVAKSKKYIRELFEVPDNEVESLRLRSKNFELIVAQHGSFTLVVKQLSQLEMAKPPEEEEDGEKKV